MCAKRVLQQWHPYRKYTSRSRTLRPNRAQMHRRSGVIALPEVELVAGTFITRPWVFGPLLNTPILPAYIMVARSAAGAFYSARIASSVTGRTVCSR